MTVTSLADRDARHALRRVIAIDGPAGAGKSSAAREVARRLGFAYLDSGALYRAIALVAHRQGIDLSQAERLVLLRRQTRLTAQPSATAFRVFVDGAEVTDELRAPVVSELASRIATFPVLRDWVGEVLRELAADRPCVAEGRDMGSRVFPDAALKVYLTASLDERARRRQLQLQDAGMDASGETVRVGIEARDARDRTRETSPLRVPADAVRIDNTCLSPAEQGTLIVLLFRGGGRRRGTGAYRCVKRTVLAAFRFYKKLAVEGAEHLPVGGFILASNHKSYADPPLLGVCVAGEVAFLAKAELFDVPLFGPLLRSLHAIPLRRHRFDRQALETAIRGLHQGRPLVVFPEGTRVPGPELGRAHAGVGLIARRADVPVVPTRILGLEKGFRGWRGRVRVRFGAPMERETDEEDGTFAERVLRAIAALGSPEQYGA